MPGSWEIVAQRENRLLLGIYLPPGAPVTYGFMEALSNLDLPPDSQVMRLMGGPPGPSRNHAAYFALQNNFHLGFLDWNIRAPRNTFPHLLGTGLDMVSGLCYLTHWPYSPIAFNIKKDEAGNWEPVPVLGWNPGDVFPVQLTGVGLVVFRHRLLEALINRYPRPFEWGADVTPIVGSGGETLPPWGEGLIASLRVGQLGFQPYVDSRVAGLTITSARVGPRWALRMPRLDNPLLGSVSVG